LLFAVNLKKALMFPLFLKLEGRRCLVVGAGTVAEGKIHGLLEAGASVQVVAPEAVPQIQKWASERTLDWKPRTFKPSDLDQVSLVIAATSSPEVNSEVFMQARLRNVLCNAVDDPKNCDFYYPAVVNRGDLQIAISTNGRSPALAQRLRRELEEQFGPEYETWVAELGAARDHLEAQTPDVETRRKLLHELASRESFISRNAQQQNRSSQEPLTSSGKVFLVGAGPGDPGLLTLRAAKALRAADVVLHDDLVSAEILRLIPSTAEVVNVGKRAGQKSTSQQEINRLLLHYGLRGSQVVRLKGGDPFIFGRGGEELEALRRAGVQVEVVPGVTAALGAAAATQIPLTHRDLSSTLILVTGNSKRFDHIANWPDRLPSNATIAVYMPGNDLGLLQQRLHSSGVAPETPCAIISAATTEFEQVHITTVANLSASPHVPAPKLLVIGEVVRFASPRQLQQFSHLTFSNQYASVSPAPGESAE
jgi:uroporphyrin-III C-methyltransferase/precorrin-2 dehydrogenase/sirohydrochlorin ferrochelatase